jgi:hypothetical protein
MLHNKVKKDKLNLTGVPENGATNGNGNGNGDGSVHIR